MARSSCDGFSSSSATARFTSAQKKSWEMALSTMPCLWWWLHLVRASFAGPAASAVPDKLKLFDVKEMFEATKDPA